VPESARWPKFYTSVASQSLDRFSRSGVGGTTAEGRRRWGSAVVARRRDGGRMERNVGEIVRVGKGSGEEEGMSGPTEEVSKVLSGDPEL